MRTTVTIDDQLYRRAKASAVRTGRTVSSVVEDALRIALAAPPAPPNPAPLPVVDGSGLLPGVDATTNAALLEAVDQGVAVDALR